MLTVTVQGDMEGSANEVSHPFYNIWSVKQTVKSHYNGSELHQWLPYLQFNSVLTCKLVAIV